MAVTKRGEATIAPEKDPLSYVEREVMSQFRKRGEGLDRGLEEYLREKHGGEYGFAAGKVRTSSTGWIQYAAPYYRKILVESGRGEEDADRVVRNLALEGMCKANPEFEEIAEAPEDRAWTEDERRKYADIYVKTFDTLKKKDINFNDLFEPLLRDKKLLHAYADEVLSKDGFTVTDVMRKLTYALFMMDKLSGGKDAGGYGAGVGEDDSEEPVEREITQPKEGVTAEDVKRECGGVDLSLVVEDMGFRVDTPEGERVMHEILNSPETVDAVKTPSSMSRLLVLAAAHDVVDSHRKDLERAA